jgi:hypothetical protein
MKRRERGSLDKWLSTVSEESMPHVHVNELMVSLGAEEGFFS